MEMTINENSLPKLEDYVATLNKRCVKNGLPVLDIVQTGRREDVDADTQIVTVWLTVEVVGQMPKINGWDFVARIEHEPEIGNIVRTVPGQTVPNEYLTAAGNCDHCNTKRSRKDTFVVRNTQTGEYKQIGRQCIRDFIGYASPDAMVWWFDIERGLNEESREWNGTAVSDLYQVTTIVRLAMSVIDMNGYVSRAKADETNRTATSTIMGTCFSRPTDKNAQEFIRNTWNNSVQFEEKTAQIVEWVKGWDVATQNKSEFNHNLFLFATKNLCRSRDFGFIAYLPIMFQKEMEPKEEAAKKSNEHLGVVGEKFATIATIVRIDVIQGAYGCTDIIKLEDAAGNSLVWFSSNKSQYDVGTTVTISGRIKDHTDYKGRKQTNVTRCKLVA